MKMEIVFKNGRTETFEDVESFNVVEEKKLPYIDCYIFDFETDIASTPTIGKIFEVNPEKIDRLHFKEKKSSNWQENTRLTILQAFNEYDKNPEKYGPKFYTLLPEKKWENKDGIEEIEVEKLADAFGGHTANWVEQALEWAQRIQNGESWRTLCNETDTIEYNRLVIWKNGILRVIGGNGYDTLSNYYNSSPTRVSQKPYYIRNDIIPLIVLNKK